MKDIYFEPVVAKPNFKRKLIHLFSHWLTVLLPKVSVWLSKKLFGNPYSRRRYQMRTQIKPKSQMLTTKYGAICLHEFSSSETNAAKNIFLCHGWGDSSTRFTQLIDALTARGFRVWSLDHLGHGLSENNYADLFQFIEGVSVAIEYLNDNGAESAVLVGHSMGTIALLNQSEALLNQRQVVLVSAPTYFFENMFRAIESIGVAKSMLNQYLEAASLDYQCNWQQLAMQANLNKVDRHFLFIHDTSDKLCSCHELEQQLINIEHQFYKTEQMGHLKLLKDAAVHQKIIQFSELAFT